MRKNKYFLATCCLILFCASLSACGSKADEVATDEVKVTDTVAEVVIPEPEETKTPETEVTEPTEEPKSEETVEESEPTETAEPAEPKPEESETKETEKPKEESAATSAEDKPSEQPTEAPAEQPAVETPIVVGPTTDAPGLVGSGFTNFVGPGTYDYTTICSDAPNVMTYGTVTLSSYTRTDAGNGYEDISGSIVISMSDENARTYGAHTCYSFTDYYYYSAGGSFADLLDGKHSKYTIVWNGVDYDKCGVIVDSAKSGWSNHVFTETYNYTIRVPAGYDGLVVFACTCPTTDFGNNLANLSNIIMYRCN